MYRHNMTRVATVAAASKKEGGFATRRLLAALFSVALLMGVFPAAVSAHSTDDDLKISIAKAPIAPDGTTAGAPLDFVVSFADPNPAVDGVGMKLGGTITIELDEAFDMTGDQGFSPAGPPPPAIILQGWPQSPRAPFPYTTDIVGNTITLTLTDDWAVGAFGPGPKAVHLGLFASTNPGAGRYEIEVEIQPDPGSGATLKGEGRVVIIPDVRPSANVMSLFSSPPGSAPPLFNPLYQDVTLGESGRQVGMYLWERGGSAAIGVDLVMMSARHGHLIQDGETVGQVWIRTPHGARNQTLTSTGPSVEVEAFVTGIPTGKFVTVFTPDADVAGHYKVTFRMRDGNSQVLRYHVSD